MSCWKSIVTVTWEFDSLESRQECLKKVKSQIDEIIESSPHGQDFENFAVQVDLVKMKDRNKLIHIKKYEPEEIFSLVTHEEEKIEFIVGEKSYFVKMNSSRYHVFKSNQNCVSCGLQGKYMILDINPSDMCPHFNFYAEENGRLVLMTKDHIVAKSKGGTNDLSNFQTCCAVCNNLKADYDLSYCNVKELREIYKNDNKLSKKELRDLINKTREKMISKN